VITKLLLTVRLALKSLSLHVLRSVLAVLGILIGIAAVIWLVALGEGISIQAQKQIKDLGATNIIIRSIKPPENSSSMGGGRFFAYGLLRADFERIARTVPTIVQATPLREIRREVRFRERVAQVRLVGCTPEYLKMNNLELAQGRFITDRDQELNENVCVLADGTAEQLFPYEDPINLAIQIDNTFYRIIGRTRYRIPSGAIGGSFSGQDYNMDVYIPLNTLRARIGDQVFTSRQGSFEGEIVELSQLTVTVRDIAEVEDTADIIQTLLQKFHPNPDYAIIVPKELLRQAEALRTMFNALLVLIASISLVVGGIGIMNIMLATVTERTREIGIRRALGAKRSDIVMQFLTETVVLTVTGGLLGIGIGFMVEPAAAWFRKYCESFPDRVRDLPATVQQIDPEIAPWSIGVSFAISLGVGVMFGLYPAIRASLMDPIEALRHE